MKTIYFLIAVLLLVMDGFTQNIDSLLSIANEINCGFFSKDIDWKIVQPIKGDIVNYFFLSGKYDTPLKKKKFYESKESWEFSDSLKTIRRQVLENWWKFEIETGNVQYDLSLGALKIGGIEACFASTINNKISDFAGVHFPMLNKYIEFASFAYLEAMVLYIKMNEDDALKIEENLDSYKYYLLFKVKDDLLKKSLTLSSGFSEWVEMPIAKICYIVFWDTKNKDWIAFNPK